MAWVGKTEGNPARCYDMGDGFGYGLAMSVTTPKNTWSPVQINSITAPTFSSTPWDPSTVSQHPTMDANTWWVSGSCDTPDVSLSFSIVHFDALGGVMGIGPPNTVSVSSSYKIASTSRYPIYGTWAWDSFQSATYFGVIVTVISTGSWNLTFNLL